MKKIILSTLLIVAIVAVSMSSAFAYGSYLTTFNTKYGTSMDCGVCHNATGGGGARNPYGTAFEGVSTHASNPGAAFDTIASSASVCSGYTYLAMINMGLYPGGHGTSIVCPTATTCNSFTYSAWGACQPDGTQSRSVLTSSPSGCTGGNPVTTQSCSYTQACTSYTYTLGACQSNNTAPVVSYVGVPSGCSGGATPATTQPCNYTAPTCNSFTYSAWDACQSDGTQSRSVMSSSPSGCTGGSPVISQTCTYVPPPTGGVTPLPTSGRTFTYKAVAAPVLSTDPSQAEPIGVGAVATGGSTFDITLGLDQFAGPVDVTFAIYASSIDPRHVYFFGSDNSFRTSRVVWRTTVRDLSDALALNVPLSALPSGQYTLILQVSPSGAAGDDGEDSSYYRWVTSFSIKATNSDGRSDDSDRRSDD